MTRKKANGADRAAGAPTVEVTSLSTALGIALTLGGAHALAQQSAASPEGGPTKTPPPQDNVTQLGKVSVHADELEPSSPKFTAPLIDTPMAVTILPQSVMQEAAAISLQDALRNVPGITFAAGEGGTPTGDLPSIRGFSSASNVYVDGMRDIGVQTRDIFDLEQIEVVKGPDSSIAGRSAGGGSINLVSKTAQLANFVSANAFYGTAGEYRAALDGNLKLTDNIAARVNIMHMGGGTPGRNENVRTDKTGAAANLSFGLQTSTRLTLNYYHFADKSTPDYGTPVDFFESGRPLVDTRGISRNNFYGLTDRDFRDNTVDSGQARLEQDFGEAFTARTQLRYTVSRNDYLLTLPQLSMDADGAQVPGFVYRLPIGNNDRTRGLISQTDFFGHFHTGALRHDVDLGFEYSQEKEQLASGSSYLGYSVSSSAGPQGFGGGDCTDAALSASYDCTSLFNPNPRDPWQGSVDLVRDYAYYSTHDLAPYFFDTITLTPQWKINGGVRWERYRTDARFPSDPASGNAADNISFTSYQVGLIYKPLENGTIYIDTSSASIPEDQAFSGAGQDQPFPASPYFPTSTGFKPEKTRTIELGTKWNLFGQRLLVSGDIFEERHTDAAIEVAPALYEQIGKTRVRGIEVSANGSVTEQWNVIAGYSLLDAKITTGGLFDEVGQQLPNTPRNTFSLWSTYRVIPALTVGGGAYYRDKQVGYAGPPDEYIDGYTRFDAMTKYQFDPHVALQLNVQNVFDKQYFSKTFYWYALPAPGRTWLVTVDLKL